MVGPASACTCGLCGVLSVVSAASVCTGSCVVSVCGCGSVFLWLCLSVVVLCLSEGKAVTIQLKK